MRELDYQSSDDRKYERGPVLRKIFGPSRAEIWSNLAEAIGARYEHCAWKGGKVVSEVGQWILTLDTYTVHAGNAHITYTRMRAPYVNADGFRFVIYRTSVFTPLGVMLGMQDIEVGDDRFDREFVIKSNNEGRTRTFLRDETLRELLRAQDPIRLEVKDDEGWFGAHFPQGVDMLQFTAVGVIKDMTRLEKLFELFAHTLNRLCHLGSAYEDDPSVRL
jgi:hypothetical protein